MPVKEVQGQALILILNISINMLNTTAVKQTRRTKRNKDLPNKLSRRILQTKMILINWSKAIETMITSQQQQEPMMIMKANTQRGQVLMLNLLHLVEKSTRETNLVIMETINSDRAMLNDTVTSLVRMQKSIQIGQVKSNTFWEKNLMLKNMRRDKQLCQRRPSSRRRNQLKNALLKFTITKVITQLHRASSMFTAPPWLPSPKSSSASFAVNVSVAAA